MEKDTGIPGAANKQESGARGRRGPLGVVQAQFRADHALVSGPGLQGAALAPGARRAVLTRVLCPLSPSPPCQRPSQCLAGVGA